MPLFTYYCEDCESEFDHLLKNRQKEDEVECPECRNSDIERKTFYGDHTIKYNTDGFHRTDYTDKNTQ